MLTRATGIEAEGTCPPEYNPQDLISYSRLAELADHIYDTRPNLVARLPGNSGAYVIKWFGWRHPLHFYLSPTFPSRAWASWTCAHALKSAGVYTPEPLWVYTRREKGRIHENVYLTRAVHPHRSLRQFFNEETPETISRVLIKVGRALARMHGAGIFHRDLTTGNFLIDPEEHVYLVDLNRAKLNQNMTLERRLVDLRKIHFPDRINTPLREAFWEAYRNKSGWDQDWDQLYQNERTRYWSRRERSKRIKAALRNTK